MKNQLALAEAERIRIYYSYAQADRARQERLDKQLALLYRQKRISSWHEGLIKAGAVMNQEINSYLDKADIILLLLSPDYLATENCYLQMERAIHQHQTRVVHVLPILLRPVTGWEQTIGSELSTRFLPLGERPVSQWTRRDEAYASIAAEIVRLVEHIIEQRTFVVRRQTPPPTHHASILLRPDVLEKIYTRLMQADHSALVLTGLCGSGKSILAAQLYHYAEAQRRAGQAPFTHEALWITIQPSMTFRDLITTIMLAHGLSTSRLAALSPQAQVQELVLLLNSENICQFIVLDQFERWLDWQHGGMLASQEAAKEWLTQVNSHLCRSRLLLTSRLQLQTTTFYPLRFIQTMPIPGLTANTGLALLRLWGRQESAETLALAVKRCEGHIQALALLVALLHQHQISLSTLLHDPAYQQLWTKELDRQLFNEYYKALDEYGRQLLLAFASYREPASRLALEAILSHLAPSTEQQLLPSAISVLLAHHLLTPVGQDERYALHPLVAESVRTRQSGSTNQQRAHTAAARYYQQCYVQRSIIRVNQRLENSHDLIEAIWQYCQAGLWRAGYTLIERESLFTYLLRQGEYLVLEELYQILAADQEWCSEPRLAAGFTNELGELHNALGRKHEALKAFTEALAQARNAAAPGLQIKALNNMGAMQRALGQVEQALACYEQAQNLHELATEAQDAVEKGITWNNLGRALASQAETQVRPEEQQRLYQCATDCYEQALHLYEIRYDEAETGKTLNNLGELYAAQGQHDQAFTTYQQALRHFRILGERQGEGTICNNLGVLYHKVARLPEAFDYYVQALAITHELGSSWEEIAILRNLGRLFIEAQDTRVALACFILARDLATKQGQPERGSIPHGVLAFLTSRDQWEQKQILERLQPLARTTLEQALSRGLPQPPAGEETLTKEDV